jgi:hypothetical protein
MRKLSLIALLAVLSLTADAQNRVRIKVVGGRSFCGFSLKRNGFYNIGTGKEYITREASPGDESGIPDVIESIKHELGFNIPIRVFLAKDEENCFASIGEDGVRLIIADQLFLNKVNRLSKTEWAAISIIAHEVGHHIAGFTRRESSLDSELDADYWSGYVLQKLGASQDASVKCIMTFGTETNTTSHPNKYLRASTIRQGWSDALSGNYDLDRCEHCE